MMLMASNSTVSSSVRGNTIWGLDPVALHDRFWASRGVQVSRVGRSVTMHNDAELYLLIDPNDLVLFDLHVWIELLDWTKPDLLVLRLHSNKSLGYREVLTANQEGDFQRFERRYKVATTISTRVGLTCEREIAEAWQSADNIAVGWRQLRQAVPVGYRETRSSPARLYNPHDDHDTCQFAQDLVAIWKQPGATIRRARQCAPSAWMDPAASADQNARIIGPVWVGAGWTLSGTDIVVGPAVLWDDPKKRPEPDEFEWSEIEPSVAGNHPVRQQPVSSFYRTSKRIFDVTFSLAALLLTLPLYPIVMLLIYLDDGRPFFFGHSRETLEGKVFNCWKFRSMRKDAHLMTPEMLALNQADGPQFFIENDPRITRVGKFLRKTHLDELPQFINVLLGHMAIVGPRPSPRGENQYCPEWREARLSVRPGITGLWQVRRTRIHGRDFQEWIKYDIQYVESMSWWLDLKLMWQTIAVMARRTVRS